MIKAKITGWQENDQLKNTNAFPIMWFITKWLAPWNYCFVFAFLLLSKSDVMVNMFCCIDALSGWNYSNPKIRYVENFRMKCLHSAIFLRLFPCVWRAIACFDELHRISVYVEKARKIMRKFAGIVSSWKIVFTQNIFESHFAFSMQ